jgi:hypothetical protein
MTLTTEELQAVSAGQAVRGSQNGLDFILLPLQAFDDLTQRPCAEHDELRALLAQSSQANGWDDPGMDAYDAYPTPR